MRNRFLVCCLSFLAGCEFQPVYGQVAQIPWDVQQNRPVAQDVPIWQGETVDLLPRLVQGIRPVAITNAPVEFRYREASLPTNTYRYVAASANTNNGVVSVRWLPDYDAGAAWYDYQIIVGSNAANPRCFGRIIMRPTIGWHASTNPPPPITLYPTRAEFQAASNALANALQLAVTSTVPAQIAVATAPLVTTSQLSNALASLPVPSADALRLVNSNATRWVDATGGVWAVTQQIAANKLLLDFSDNASFFSGQCSAIDTVVDVPCANVPCGQVLMNVGVNGWTMKNLFNTSSQIAGMFNIPVTFPITVNFSGAHQGSLTFRQITEHLTNCVDAVVFNSALTGNALRLINPTNSAEWTDGAGDLWRVTTTTGWHFSSPDFPANDGFVEGLTTPFPEYFERSDARGALFVSRLGVNPITVEYLYDMGSWWGGFQDNGATSYVIADGNGIYTDALLDYRSVSVTTRVDQVAYRSAHELHADSFTNLIWRTVWSNGWCWAVAHTNTP